MTVQDRLDDILADESTWAEPSPHVLDGVLDEIGASPRRRRFRPVLVGGIAAAVVAGVVGVVGVGLLRSSSDDGDAGAGQQVALAGTELAPEASAVATLRDTPTGVAVSLEVEGLPPAPEGSYYQAWVKGPAGLVTIGTFHNREPDDEPVELWSGVDSAAYPDITVTLEPEDGDPASSGQRVLVGSLGN